MSQAVSEARGTVLVMEDHDNPRWDKPYHVKELVQALKLSPIAPE